MRSFVISIALFIIVVGLIVLNSLYVNNIIDTVSDIANRISKQDTDAINELYELWHSSERLLSLSVRESKLERMSELISSLSSARDAGNHNEIKRLCSLVGELCRDIAQYERLSAYSLV